MTDDLPLAIRAALPDEVMANLLLRDSAAELRDVLVAAIVPVWLERETALRDALAEEERQHVQACAVLDVMGAAVDGTEPSDFMLSFGSIRRAWDLHCELQRLTEERDEIRRVLELFISALPCRLSPEGFCWQHGGDPCPQVVLRDWLQRLTAPAREETR